MTRTARLLIPLLVIALLLAACSGQAPTQAPQPAATSASASEATSEPQPEAPTAAPAAAKSITVHMYPNDPRSIDPQRAIDTREWNLLEQLFPGLTVLNTETHDIMPAMAESWDISDDGLVYTFHLLQGVPWVRYNAETGAVEEVKDENGEVRYVTAEDFVFGFLRALNPESGSPAAYMLAPYIVGAEEYNAGTGSADAVGVRAVDEYTFEITAPEKVGFALQIYAILNARATPAWAIEAGGDAWTEPENINTYGPFVLKEWVHDASQTMIKNPFWPGSEGIGQPTLDEIVFRFIDEEVGLREYEAGGIDVTLVPGTQIERLKVDPVLGGELKITAGTCVGYWSFDTTRPPFDNVHMRRAFNYAIDRETLCVDVLGGGEIPARFMVPPSIRLAPSAGDMGDLGITFDPDKAKEELALGLQEMGLASVDELPTITAWLNSTPTQARVGQALQAMWQETLGAKVELQQLDNTVYWSTLEKETGNIVMAGWCPDYNDANNYLSDVFRSDSIYNYGHWSNEEFDKLVDQARVETDEAKRLELYTQAEQLLNVEDAGMIMLNYGVRAQLTKPRVQRTYSQTAIEHYWDWDVTE